MEYATKSRRLRLQCARCSFASCVRNTSAVCRQERSQGVRRATACEKLLCGADWHYWRATTKHIDSLLNGGDNRVCIKGYCTLSSRSNSSACGVGRE